MRKFACCVLFSFLRDGEETREGLARRPAEKASSPTFYLLSVLVDTWDQDLFVKSGLHLIYDDIFEISPSLTATSEPPDVTKDQCNYDMIWSDLDAHILCRLQFFRRLLGLDFLIVTLLEHDFVILLPLVWILRYFKTRGRVFSNQGRMMGSEKLKQWIGPFRAHLKIFYFSNIEKICLLRSVLLPPRRRRNPRRVGAKASREGFIPHLLPPLRSNKFHADNLLINGRQVRPSTMCTNL
ncbi:hypothetical protein Taro_035255, partial [Colocasia esculenta]|nr:hypothetical protein [Colocasia esculenta]